jgi:hypothetical protein
MFNGASAFDQNIRVWDTDDVSNYTDMFTGATEMISTYNGVTGFGTTPTAEFFNYPPQFTSTPVGAATEDHYYTYTVTTNDVDGDTVTLTGTTIPGWLNWTAATGELSGTPDNSNLGTSGNAVVITANDGTVDVTQEFTITVANMNSPPTFTSTPVTSATQGVPYDYTVIADDTNGDTVTFTLTAPAEPTWLTLNTTTGELTGTPGNSNLETSGNDVVIAASDGNGGVTNQSFTIWVAFANDAPTGTVTISGTPTQGQVLTASNNIADVDGMGAITYTWSNGATGSTYTLQQSDVGNTITVTASYTDQQGTSESVTSAPTSAIANVNDAPTGTVTISGTPTQGQVLTASNTIADADGMGAITYTWSNGATGSTYTLQQSDVGTTITVTASYTDQQGTPESVTSAPTSAVANVDDAATGSISISGTVQTGATLTAVTSGLSDPDGSLTFTYQWKSSTDNINFSDISGETSNTYVIPSDQTMYNKYLQVIVTTSDPEGGTGTFSATTAQVSGVIWPQIGSNIDGDYPDDNFGKSISLSDDGTIVAIGAMWYDDSTITFTASTNLVTITGHNYDDNDRIGFAGITGGIGLGNYEKYYVINSTPNTFQLSDTQGPTVLEFYDNGTADNGYTFTESTNLVTKNSHGKSYGDTIVFSNVAGPTMEIVSGTTYYVISSQPNTFKLSATIPSALTIIDILGDGTATTTVTVESDNTSNKGSVQIWKNTAGTWAQLGSTIVGENYRDKFGQSVALNAADVTTGDIRVVAGARGANSGSGRVRVFEYDSGTTSWGLLGNNIDTITTKEQVVLNASTNKVEYTNHGYNDNDIIAFVSGISNITNISTNIYPNDKVYYVTNAGTNDFQLSKTFGGTAITFSGSANDNAVIIENKPWHTGEANSINNTGNIVAVGAASSQGTGLVNLYKYGTSVTYAATTNNLFTLTNHGLSVGDKIVFSSLGATVGTDLAINTTYYVLAPVAADTFKISKYDGTEINITNGGDCVVGPWGLMGRTICGQSGSNLGFSVSLNAAGDVVAIGAPQMQSYLDDNDLRIPNPDGGYVGIYENSNINDTTNSWTYKGPLIRAANNQTYTIASSTLTLANHGFSDGNIIAFATITTTTEISAYIGYYVINKTDDTFQLSTTSGGAVINLTNGSAERNSGENMGSSISLNDDGDIVAIGSDDASDGATNTVKIYKYNSGGNTWDQLGSSISKAKRVSPIALNSEADGTDGNTFITICDGNDGVEVYRYDDGSNAWSKYNDSVNSVTPSSVSMNAAGTIVATGYTGSVSPNSYDLTIADNLFTLNNHGFVDDDIISFSSISLTTGVSAGTSYYVKTATTNTFQISETTTTNGGAGTTVDLLSSNGTATGYTGSVSPNLYDLTIADNLFTLNNHGFVDDDRISFGSISLTVGVSAGTSYYVKTATTNTFQISETTTTNGGAGTTVDLLSSNGTAERYFATYGIGYAKMNTIATVPDAPTISATPYDVSIQITFSAEANGAPITDYLYFINNAATGVSIGQTTSPYTITTTDGSTRLSNGTSYNIKLKAVSSIGNSDDFSNSVTVIPIAVPDKPTNVSSSAENDGTVIITFTPGADNGTAITDYNYQIDTGSWVSVGSTSSPFTISSGLSLGTSHNIKLRAVNSVGDGAESSATSVIPATKPDPPTITNDTTGDNNSAIVHFTAGANNGRTITNYKYSVDGATAVELGNTTTPFTITSLINGQSYSIRLYAYNEMGWSDESVAKIVTPEAVPDSPTINTTTPGNQQIEITFTPGNDNGSTITNYEYSINSGSWTARDPVSDNSPITITGLTNGTSYVVMLRAVNANGPGPSASSSSVTPVTIPSAPTNVEVTAGNAQAYVTYYNSPSDGGSAIIRYEQSTDEYGTTWNIFDGQTSESIPRQIITGLTNNQQYYLRVRAVNAVGNGTPSSPAVEFTPILVPGAPTITGIIPGNTTASVEFNAGNAYGTTITTYQYLLTVGGVDGEWTNRSDSGTTGSPLAIIGLTNGRTYQVRIRAVNSSGGGESSNATTTEPVGSPTAPAITSATAGNKQITIYFNPGQDWGSAVVNYQYSFENSSFVNWFAIDPIDTTSPITINKDGSNDLINGTAYTVKIRTVREYGPDPTSSSAVTVIPATVPDAPSISVVSGNLSAIITITDGSNNGRTITNYQYSTNNGSTWTILDPASVASPLTLTGLTFDQTYQIKLKSYNEKGWSSESTAKSVTIAKEPDAPIIDSATASNGKVTIVFTAGNSNNLPITNYKYSIDNGSTSSTRSPASITSPLVITGLTNGQEYKIILYAVNDAGVGSGSVAQTVTLPSSPDAPTIVVNPGYESLAVSITAGEDNGSAITNYQYKIDSGDWTTRDPASTDSPLIIPNLINGQLYQVAVKAINEIGISPASESAEGRPESVPGSPTITSATPSDQKISVVFTPGSTNGFTILNYQYSLDNASTWITRDPVSTNTTIEITKLANGQNIVNGQTYQVRLRATNINGNSPESNLISVTPATYPDPPSIISVTADDKQASIAFTAGADNGATITNYQYSVNNGSTWSTRNPVSANSPLIITGLTNGKTYEIKLRAVNSIGYGNATVMYPVIPFSDVPEPVLTVGPNNTIIVPTYGLEVLTSGTPAENRTMRIKFIKALLTDNATLITGNKLLIDTKTLLGESTPITKQYVRILNTYTTIPILPTVERFKLSVLESDEGIYLPLDDINDSIILQLTEGNFNWFMKFVKATVTQYQVYEDYGNINTPITSVKTIGDTGNHRYFSYIIDSVSGEYNPPPSPVPICFPKGTPVSTDQGNIDIEKIIPNVHTIRGKQIVAITKTIPNHAEIVSISKDAFERNIPSKKTIISQEHKVVYKSRLIKAKDLVNCCKGVTMIPYDGKPLYNVLMKQYDYMMINNLTCETLHPESIMSKIYNSKFTYTEQNLICADLTNVLASNNAPAYNKLCNSIRYFEREKSRGRNVDIRVGYHGIGSSIYSKQSK